MRHRLHRYTTTCAAVLVTAGMLACGGESIGPKAPPAVSQFWALTLNHHAITLATIAPYDTLTLVATPRTAAGTALATTDPVIYTSSDTSVVVTPDGQIRANTVAEVTTNVLVIATMTVGGAQGVTLADTAVVNVVAQTSPATVPVVGTFSLQPLDSAVTWGGGGYFEASVTDNSADPQPIPWVQVYYHTPQNTILTYDRWNGGYVSATGVGRVMLYADAVIYGKAVRDSLRVTVGYQTQTFIEIGIDSSRTPLAPRGFPPDTIFLALGGTVIWHNVLFGLPNDSIDIKFTGPAPVQSITDPISMNVFDPSANDYYRDLTILPDAGGDIAPFVALGPAELNDSTGISVKGRRFTVAGTYTYSSRFFPGTGIIRVVPNAEIP